LEIRGLIPQGVEGKMGGKKTQLVRPKRGEKFSCAKTENPFHTEKGKEKKRKPRARLPKRGWFQCNQGRRSKAGRDPFEKKGKEGEKIPTVPRAVKSRFPIHSPKSKGKRTSF